jgi:TPR repeat protein
VKIKLLAGLVLAVAIGALPGAGLAAEPEYDNCAAQAASPYEKGFARTGRYDFQLFYADAIAACEAALEKLPASVQVKTWLARAYRMASRDTEAYDLLITLPVVKTNPLGAMLLGLQYRDGAGVAQDYARALELLTLAAETGFAPAQYFLGSSYDNEYGVTRDVVEAAKWYKRAADQGEPQGLSAMGSIYLYGEGGYAFDEEKGVALLTQAGEMGESLAWQYLGIAYANSPHLGQNYAKAAEAFAKAAELGDAYSMVELGYYYDAGWGVEPDLNKAFELTKRGADLGNAHGLSNLAYYYEHGIGTEVDLPAAFDAAKRSAELGSTFGAVNLGWFYLRGIGTEINCDEALRWTMVGYEANDINSIENLGEHYANGCGVDQDLLRARDLYKIALDGGSTTVEPLMEELKGLMKISNLI